MFAADAGRRIHHYQDELIELDVRERDGLRWLHFGSDGIQTAMRIAKPHELVLDYLPALLGALQCLPKLENVCVLGLGGGTIVQHLLHYFVDCRVTAIELNPAVIQIAQDYFSLPRKHPRFKLIQGDAANYIACTHQSFDAILTDVASATEIPAPFTSAAFFRTAKRHLNTPGYLGLNYLLDSNGGWQHSLAYCRKLFNGHTFCIPIKDYNNMIIACLNTNNLTKSLQDKNENYLIEKPQYTSDCGIVSSGFVRLPWLD